MVLKEFFLGCSPDDYISIYDSTPGDNEKHDFFIEGFSLEIMKNEDLEPYLDYYVNSVRAKAERWLVLEIRKEKRRKSDINKYYKLFDTEFRCMTALYEPVTFINWNKFYKRLKELMKDKEMKKIDLANKMHMSEDRINQAFKEKKPWTEVYLKKFAEAFDVDEGLLLRDCFVKKEMHKLMRQLVEYLAQEISEHVIKDKLDEFKGVFTEYMNENVENLVEKEDRTEKFFALLEYKNLKEQFPEYFHE